MMSNGLLKSVTVLIPGEDRRTVIRKGKTIEYETERSYSPETKDTRVKRQVIGKADPMHPGRMFPNENYFRLFPQNEVPEDVREAFLRECAMRRDIDEVKRHPEELARRIVSGMELLKTEGMRSRMERMENGRGERAEAERMILFNMFEQVYYYMEELAGRFPNEIVDEYKVKAVNEVLREYRACMDEGGMERHLELIEPPKEEVDENGKRSLRGKTYSDVMILLKWYKSMTG